LVLFYPDSAKADIGWDGKLNGDLCQKYSYQKLSKSVNRCSSYNRKCLKCLFFSEHDVKFEQFIKICRQKISLNNWDGCLM